MEKSILRDRMETDLNIQADRMYRNANGFVNKVIPFKPVDEELLKEYNAQFPSHFDQVSDVDGKKTYRKFRVPQDEPILDEPELETLDRHDYQLYEEDAMRAEKNLVRYKQAIRQLEEAIVQMRNTIISPESLKTKMIQEAQTKLENVRQALTHANNVISGFDAYKRDFEDKEASNRSKILITKKKNADRVAQYGTELKYLNRGAFNTEQLEGEDESEYFQRLKNNAEITTTDESLENAKQMMSEQFRNKVKELIRDPVKINEICKRVVPSYGEMGYPDPTNKVRLLKIFPLFKKKFEERYGLNNKYISADEVVQYMKSFLKKDAEGLTEDEAPIKKEEDPEVHFMSGTPNNLYLRKIKPNMGDDRSLKVLYSFSGDRDTYKGFTRTDKSTTLIKDATGIRITKEDALRMLEKKLNTTDFKTMRGDYFTDKETYGWGIQTEELPKEVKFGKLTLLLHKLYYHNILAVKHSGNISIAGLKNTKVSDKFVALIMSLIQGDHPTHTEINALPMIEKQLYDRLIHLAHLNKKLPHTEDKTIHDLKKRMKLIEGEIHAGNNSPLLKKELYVICHALKDFGVLSMTELKDYLSQF
jgi:hypothetical protein